MKKGWIIALSVLLIVAITIVTLSFTLFTVQEVSINYRTSTDYSYDDKKIIESSQIPYGNNIFFLNKSQLTSNIEQAYPYLEVINIETKFPSSLIIHVKERQSVYAVKNGENFLLLDSQLKVLDKLDTFESDRTNAIYLPIEVQADVGDFINLNLLSNFYDAFLLNNKSREDALSLFKQIEIFDEKNQIFNTVEDGLKLTLFSGREVFIHNANYGLAYKIAKFFAVEKALPELSDQLSDEVIQNSEIHINNFLGPNYTDKDSYFYLIYNGEKVSI